MKLVPLLFEVLESRETANLQVCRKVMANLLKRKIAPVPFAGSVTDARTVLASLRTRNTPPAIWLINTYWAEEMLPELDTMMGNTPVIFFKRDLFGAGLSTQMPAIGAPDKISTILGKMTPRLTVLWAFGTGNSETVAGRVADAVANYLADGNFRHIEEASPGHNSVSRAMTSANENLQAFRAQLDVPAKGSSTTSAPAVREGDAPPRPRSRPGAPVRRGITGNIEQLGLSTLLMMMEMEKKTGELVLNSDNTQATLFIKGGRIVGAAARGGGVSPDIASGPECVFSLFLWKTGNFEFLIKDVTCEDTVQASTTSLLMEGARRMDEASSGGNGGGGDSILG